MLNQGTTTDIEKQNVLTQEIIKKIEEINGERRTNLSLLIISCLLVLVLGVMLIKGVFWYNYQDFLFIIPVMPILVLYSIVLYFLKEKSYKKLYKTFEILYSLSIAYLVISILLFLVFVIEIFRDSYVYLMPIIFVSTRLSSLFFVYGVISLCLIKLNSFLKESSFNLLTQAEQQEFLPVVNTQAVVISPEEQQLPSLEAIAINEVVISEQSNVANNDESICGLLCKLRKAITNLVNLYILTNEKFVIKVTKTHLIFISGFFAISTGVIFFGMLKIYSNYNHSNDLFIIIPIAAFFYLYSVILYGLCKENS